jgi:hypothetical protein
MQIPLNGFFKEHFDRILDFQKIIKNKSSIGIDTPFSIDEYQTIADEKKYDMIISFHVFPKKKEIIPLIASYKNQLNFEGTLNFSILGQNTLKELRIACFETDLLYDRAILRVIPMLKIEALSLMIKEFFKSSVINKEEEKIYFESFKDLLMFLRKFQMTLPYFNIYNNCEKDYYIKLKNYYENNFQDQNGIFLTMETYDLFAFF